MNINLNKNYIINIIFGRTTKKHANRYYFLLLIVYLYITLITLQLNFIKSFAARSYVIFIVYITIKKQTINEININIVV